MKTISLDNIGDEDEASQTPVDPQPAAKTDDIHPSISTAPTEESEDEESPAVDDSGFVPASDLKSAFQQLAEAERLPERTPIEWQLKAQRLAIVRKHVSTLQQGLPAVVLTADDIAVSHRKHSAILRQQRLEYLAREHPEVRALLESHRRLEAELAALQKK